MVYMQVRSAVRGYNKKRWNLFFQEEMVRRWKDQSIFASYMKLSTVFSMEKDILSLPLNPPPLAAYM